VKLVEQILTTRQVHTPDGATLPLQDSIDAETGALLQNLIFTHRPSVSLEIGLAYGVSALFICEALSVVGGTKHVVIDAAQSTTWKGIGLANLRTAGFAPMVDFREEYSQDALPKLCAEGLEIDFAFIDGTHTFDQKMIDFFYVDCLLRTGGVIAFDDCDWPSIRALCRFIATNRSYRVCAATHAGGSPSLVRRATEWATRHSSHLRRLVAPRFVQSDLSLGLPIDSRCVAFEKLAKHQVTPAYVFREF
jgi:predicted O-methyltransferase YrrM